MEILGCWEGGGGISGFWLAWKYLFHKENVCGPFLIFACLGRSAYRYEITINSLFISQHLFVFKFRTPHPPPPKKPDGHPHPPPPPLAEYSEVAD